jgi:hypothetical protein
MPDLVDSSVEQRCARIRGRMVWILSQLESDVGGNILTDADSKSGSSGEQLRAQQQAHERELEEELKREQGERVCEQARREETEREVEEEVQVC